jgi:hypothetical protein
MRFSAYPFLLPLPYPAPDSLTPACLNQFILPLTHPLPRGERRKGGCGSGDVMSWRIASKIAWICSSWSAIRISSSSSFRASSLCVVDLGALSECPESATASSHAATYASWFRRPGRAHGRRAWWNVSDRIDKISRMQREISVWFCILFRLRQQLVSLAFFADRSSP